MILHATDKDASDLAKQAETLYRHNNITNLVTKTSQLVFSNAFRIIKKREEELKFVKQAILCAVEAAYTEEFDTSGMSKRFATLVKDVHVEKLKKGEAEKKKAEADMQKRDWELLLKQKEDELAAKLAAKDREIEDLRRQQRGPLGLAAGAAAEAAASAAAAFGIAPRAADPRRRD